MANIVWKFVKGGICKNGEANKPKLIKDLLWTETPITWANISRNNPLEPSSLPITGLNFKEAIILAEDLGGRLPSSIEWEWMAAGAEERIFPWGNDPWDETKGNLLPLNGIFGEVD